MDKEEIVRNPRAFVWDTLMDCACAMQRGKRREVARALLNELVDGEPLQDLIERRRQEALEAPNGGPNGHGRRAKGAPPAGAAPAKRGEGERVAA